MHKVAVIDHFCTEVRERMLLLDSLTLRWSTNARRIIDCLPSWRWSSGYRSATKLVPRPVDRYGLQCLSYFRVVSINYVRTSWRTAGFRAVSISFKIRRVTSINTRNIPFVKNFQSEKLYTKGWKYLGCLKLTNGYSALRFIILLSNFAADARCCSRIRGDRFGRSGLA